MDAYDNKSILGKLITALVVVYLLVAVGLGVYWSVEPEMWDVERTVEQEIGRASCRERV